MKTIPAILIMALGLLSGCSTGHQPQMGPNHAASLHLRPESINGLDGYELDTPHYTLHSTIPDEDVVRQMGQLMEGAFTVYQSLAPSLSANGRPMQCYLFLTRAEWAEFTRSHTGEDATIYLGVNRGGYTVGDWYVAYWMGPEGTASVAAHEGWHQYSARNLKGRLPPFLEEGLACLFEQVQFKDGLPRWDLSQNQPRLMSLRSAIDANKLFRLDKLIRMHAGQVVGKPAIEIESFYAQSWAFARFMLDGDGGTHRPALSQMLGDAAAGRLFDDSSEHSTIGHFWHPATARPMLEHYLGMSLPEIAADYDRYIRAISARAGSGVLEGG